MQVDRIIEVKPYRHESLCLYFVNCLQAASVDTELKTRTVHLSTFVMWPLSEKGRQRKPSTDAMKLNKDVGVC